MRLVMVRRTGHSRSMTGQPRDPTIATVEQLVALVGEPSARVAGKVRDRLTDDDRNWLAESPFCLVATSDAAGRCDVSPKGDPAGSLVHVVDDRTLAIAERPGNRRVDGYRNVIENPHVGMVFIVPGRSDTLRVNGSARLVSDAQWFDHLLVQGRRPVLALVVTVEEVFGHCAKSLVRGRVWHPETWPTRADAVRAREDEQIAAYSVPLY